ncbi:anti-sigma factor [Bradyrhizobium ontarionense]|uniref:Anti-sigma factor n=1 Tax=Bradyrhizobium ontarionense TaxID=2898149 RepID=A0ABY3RK00_9BRAD|nr:anti-sigma factor [Bradyrhizobium sp. A19]UFZ07810.1 anti-sigma factor [Bradyrhizobium sp. A19]
MAYSEDHIALAAEYALGTLDAAERAQVETMMAVDKDYAVLVQTWELRLGPLNQMVGLVEPRPELWQRIKAEIARLSVPAEIAVLPEPAVAAEAPVVVAPSEPSEVPLVAEAPEAPTVVAEPPQVEAPKVEAPKIEAPKLEAPPVELPKVELPKVELPKAEVADTEVADTEVAKAELPARAPPIIAPPRTAAPVADVAGDNANVVRLSSKVRQWRAVANVMTALAAALLALVGVQVYRPDLLPQPLRPKPRLQTVETKAPTAAQSPAQFVALLQKDAASPAFILTVDAASKSYTVRRVGASPEPGKSFELWLVSDKLQRPRSLGVIGGSDFTSRPVLSAYDADTVNRATYAVTVEPEGGSPTGVATGPIVFTGKLIETVPPTR